MGTLRKLSLKAKSSKKTGSGTDSVFKPEWFAYSTMERFLNGGFSTTTNTKFRGNYNLIYASKVTIGNR